MKIYVVTEGDYSDYKICGIYSNKRNARKALKLYGKWAGIEEHVIDAFPKSPKGMFAWRVKMNRNGDTEEVININITEFERYPEQYAEGAFLAYTLARNKSHAIKIANERRAQLIAENWFDIEEAKAHALRIKYVGMTAVTGNN